MVIKKVLSLVLLRFSKELIKPHCNYMLTTKKENLNLCCYFMIHHTQD